MSYREHVPSKHSLRLRPPREPTVVIVFACNETLEGLLGPPTRHIPCIIILSRSAHVESGICRGTTAQHLSTGKVDLQADLSIFDCTE